MRAAALALLAEDGFEAVTLPAVARRAGVNKTTVYRRWSSPIELVHDALSELEALALPDLDTGSWEGDVEAFVGARLQLVSDPTAAAILRAVIAMSQTDATLGAWVAGFWEPREREWRSPVERAIERGELEPSAREVPLLQLVAGPLLLSHLATKRPLSSEQLASLSATIAAGVKAVHGRSAGDAPAPAGSEATSFR